MSYDVKILCDSLAPSGIRLTTWELTYPRFIHAEIMTHRVFSRNAASSRAIPSKKLIERIKADPAMPVFWGKNQAGMQAAEELDPEKKAKAMEVWLKARDVMIDAAEVLQELGLHKQVANRILEPWMNITVILSSTNWTNFFHQRTHLAAQPEFQYVAKMMWEQYNDLKPRELAVGEWHLPLIHEDDRFVVWNGHSVGLKPFTGNSVEILKKVSVGRCARVSYLTHDGKRDLLEDIKLHDKLLSGQLTEEPLHMSPFEHVAQALAVDRQSGNYRGWKQYRKEIPGEHFGGSMP